LNSKKRRKKMVEKRNDQVNSSISNETVNQREEVRDMDKKAKADWKFVDWQKLGNIEIKANAARITRTRDRKAIFVVLKDGSVISIRASKKADGTIYASTTIPAFQQAEQEAAQVIEI
jgi:predicted metal-dependent peptidase